MDRVHRRDFLIAAGAFLAAPVAAEAEQRARIPRIGYLAFNSEAIGRDVLVAFRRRLRELGWNDGQNITIETRFADGKVDRLPGLAGELLRANVDLMVTGAPQRPGRASLRPRPCRSSCSRAQMR